MAAGGKRWNSQASTGIGATAPSAKKHGVSLSELESLFRRPVMVEPDPAHSAQEERFKAIGTTDAGRHVFVVFTLRRRAGDTLIRPVSARYMHSKEVKHYEKETSKVEE